MIDFCLLTADVAWDEEALMDQSHYVLHNDVKDLLLTFHEDPKPIKQRQLIKRCDVLIDYLNGAPHENKYYTQRWSRLMHLW